MSKRAADIRYRELMFSLSSQERDTRANIITSCAIHSTTIAHIINDKVERLEEEKAYGSSDAEKRLSSDIETLRARHMAIPQ